LRRRPKTEILKEGSHKRFGSKFHVNRPATANALLAQVILWCSHKAQCSHATMNYMLHTYKLHNCTFQQAFSTFVFCIIVTGTKYFSFIIFHEQSNATMLSKDKSRAKSST